MIGSFPLGAVPLGAVLEGEDFSVPSRFDQLLADADAPRIFLVEVKAWDGSQVVTHYFSAPGPGR